MSITKSCVDEKPRSGRRLLAVRDKARDLEREGVAATHGLRRASTNTPAHGTATVALTNGKLSVSFSSFKLPLGTFRGDAFRITDSFFERATDGIRQ